LTKETMRNFDYEDKEEDGEDEEDEEGGEDIAN
jgi:hypothetical protein